MTGRTELTIVVAFFVFAAVVTLASDLVGYMAAGSPPSVGRTIANIGYLIAAYFLNRGSNAARIVLLIIAALGAILSIGAAALLLSETGPLAILLFLVVGVGSGYCFYLLTFSSRLREELNARDAVFGEKERLAAQRFYEDLEGNADKQ